MHEDNPNFLKIPKHTDILYGYLSNDSKYGFTEKDGNNYVYWPTVTHYIEAKKFEGTQYEHTIRKARTVTQVKILSREREINVTTRDITNYDLVDKCKVYGNKNVRLQAVSTWEKDIEHNLRAAIAMKFNQNNSIKIKLISTTPRVIVGDGERDTLTAMLLMELRESSV